MNTKTTQKLLKNSYERKDKKTLIDGYQIDKKLSGNRAQVYFNDENKKAVIVHRGTQGPQDFITDGLLSIGVKTNRFTHAEKIQNKAIDKYGKENLLTMGHSLGGSLAEDVSKKGPTITLNKPVLLQDIGKNIGNNQTDIKTSNDPVSFLRQYQKGNKAINIPSNSNSLLTEHKTDTLGRIDKTIDF